MLERRKNNVVACTDTDLSNLVMGFCDKPSKKMFLIVYTVLKFGSEFAVHRCWDNGFQSLGAVTEKARVSRRQELSHV